MGMANAQSQQVLSTKERTAWFEEARFGMFIHWGLYSAAEGIWKGERLRHFNNYAEWIKYRNRIPTAQYGELAKRFDWEKIDPEEWVILAKKAGMKYITITAKHHDGVAIWNSSTDDYNLPNLAGTDRDIIAELAEACRKHDIKLGFYYSHWIDWAHPYGWNHNLELTGKVSDDQFDQYWQEKVIPQLRELLTDYGDVAMLWFDMWIPHKQTIVQEKQLQQVIDLVREFQPNCLINSRLGLPASLEDIDFETLGDNQLGAVYKKHPWQTPGTIAHSWGYNALENQWKSTSQLLQAMIGNVSLNGNFMLNIGPRADGSFPFEGRRRLEDIGEWLRENGRSIYKSEGLPLSPSQHDWGKITTNTDDHTIYLQVYNWPLDRQLNVTGITSAPKNIYLLADKLKEPLEFDQDGPLLHIQLPDLAPDRFVSVVAMEFDQIADLDTEVVAEATFKGFSLNGKNSLESWEIIDFDGTSPSHIVFSEADSLSWKVYIPQPGDYTFDLSYNIAQSESNASVQLKTGRKTLSSSVSPSGKIVVEPYQEFYADQFPEIQLGKVHFDHKGYHEVTLTVFPSEEGTLLFNWLWMEAVE
ncbi:alpha-L-fucosidase [Echinicola soli]|uniref:alpha-L-fucosidase n=2 Tax=Echinicola soli TaxID=2591634 RepID=A0A514CP40_9BACT|nr:alpha-L-fucosidase [Echinicola soli]